MCSLSWVRGPGLRALSEAPGFCPEGPGILLAGVRKLVSRALGPFWHLKALQFGGPLNCQDY